MHDDVRQAKEFANKVYAIVRTIPEGKVTTYGAVARMLGLPQCARQVGTALAGLHSNSDVPAHRVVNRSGVLTGGWAFGSPGVMRALLEAEGVTFTEDGNVCLTDHLWEPS